ncbi:AEC family transporter [Roseococcus sp. YIM B11640]|uniref:AEC family transporter n=1 Tax=Roseococcus sp. YIM B11640 TaxID=3133973 RepID=UPI003C7A573E
MRDAALVVLQVVAPIFAIILAGYLAASRRFIDAAGFKGLNSFAFGLAAPSLLFASGTAGHQGGGAAALAFFLGAGLLYAATLIGARVAGLPLAPSGALALDVSYGNTVMMGIPLIAAGFGQEGLSVLIAILALHSLLLLGAGTVIAEIAHNADAKPLRLLRATIGGMLTNPVFVAVFAALVWSALHLPVPGPARSTLQMLGAAAPPVALFCLGGSLNGFNARAGWRQTGVTVVLKLAALPLIVWAMARLLGLSDLEVAVAVVAAALPTGANAFLLARRYASGADASGAAVLVSTTLSVVTLSVLLGAFAGVR